MVGGMTRNFTASSSIFQLFQEGSDVFNGTPFMVEKIFRPHLESKSSKLQKEKRVKLTLKNHSENHKNLQ